LSFLFILIDFNKDKNLKNIILLKGRKYLDFCLKGRLINNNIYKKYEVIKITAIIPIFNCEYSIKSVIRSIQNQKMYELEILLVNDNSKDNSSQIIQKLQKEDHRIKIINNKKNMGTLYSRCIGVLEAKGKYIFPLDNDDLIFDNNIFNIVYKEAVIHNYDIIGFKHIQANDYKANINEMKNGCHMHDNEFIIYQPKLSLFSISKNNKFVINEVHIWSKSIRTSLYQMAVNALGAKRYSLFVSWAEDTSMVFTLFNFAKSYRYMKFYGIFRYNRQSSASNKMPLSNRLLGDLFLLDLIFSFTKNTQEDKKFVVYKAIQIKARISTISLNLFNKNYLILLLKKIFNCNFISKNDKDLLKEIYKNII
jgi:glycosyltransferase involved in cell wall biosynthesis